MKKITLITLTIITGFLSTDALYAVAAQKALPLLPPKAVPALQQPALAKQPPAVSLAMPAENIYSYNPAGKPDPFRPFVEDEITAKKKEAKKSISSIYPLQKREVNEFRLVGIAGDQTRRVAIVIEDMTKKHYPLSIGTHIGVNNGKVVDILPDRVIVEEYKARKAKRIILRLHKNQDEVKP